MLRFIPGLTGTTYEERLVEVGLDSLADRRLRQDMITTYRIITGTDRMDANDMFNFYGLDARPTRASAYQWNIVEPRARTELRRLLHKQSCHTMEQPAHRSEECLQNTI